MINAASAKRPAGKDVPKRSVTKREAILAAATDVFLRDGFLGASMDEVAARSSVSKQTIYKQFTSKEALFVEIVTRMTRGAGDVVHNEMPDFEEGGDLATYLSDYAHRQLVVVLTPRIMQLRRLVIGEVGRFPRLAEALYEGGPKRAIETLARLFTRLRDRGLLTFKDPLIAASQFNWLVMAAPLNQAMLLGDEAIPKPAELRRHAAEAVRLFLAAYGRE
jgi:AcrR family transcriptional regulator